MIRTWKFLAVAHRAAFVAAIAGVGLVPLLFMTGVRSVQTKGYQLVVQVPLNETQQSVSTHTDSQIHDALLAIPGSKAVNRVETSEKTLWLISFDGEIDRKWATERVSRRMQNGFNTGIDASLGEKAASSCCLSACRCTADVCCCR